jgi:DnaJ-class molecular chaperone
LRDEQNFYGQKFQAENICPVCKGAGKTVTKICDRCNGHRLISNLKTI